MQMTTSSAGEGAIHPDTLYSLIEFKRRTGLGTHAMRTARRNGLKVRYLGGRAFVMGGDFFAYLDRVDAASVQMEGRQ